MKEFNFEQAKLIPHFHYYLKKEISPIDHIWSTEYFHTFKTIKNCEVLYGYTENQ